MALCSSKLATKANVIFKLRLEDADNDFGVFHQADGKIKHVQPTEHFYSNYANGYFEFGKNEANQSLLTFASSSVKKTSIVFVLKIDGLWRFRGGLIVTEDIGVIGYPLHTTFEMAPRVFNYPSKFDKSTVMIIAIDTKKTTVTMKLKVFADSMSQNGPYMGEIQWNRYSNDSNIVFSPSLQAANGVRRTYSNRDSAKVKQPMAVRSNEPQQEVIRVPEEKNEINWSDLPPLPSWTSTDDEDDNNVATKPMVSRNYILAHRI